MPTKQQQEKGKKAFEPFPVHFLKAVSLRVTGGLDGGRVFGFGDELTVTEDIIELNTDRLGNCGLLDAIERGEAVRRGPWPDGVSRLLPGSFEWEAERERARKAAHKLDDPEERTKALAKVTEVYGPAPTSRTLSTHRPQCG